VITGWALRIPPLGSGSCIALALGRRQASGSVAASAPTNSCRARLSEIRLDLKRVRGLISDAHFRGQRP
jgi:hypothetical protein